MRPSILFEACVDSVESAVEAAAGGAARVELCADLLEGGITPSAGMIGQVCRRLQIPVHVLIRPRGADFCYSQEELAVMADDIDRARELGAAAVVLGVLCPDGSIDMDACAALIQRAGPLHVTFHRAFDVARAPMDALEHVVELGADTLLTSGQEATALEGAPLIAKLVERAGERIQIMAGGGIHEGNVARVVAATGVRAVHATARASVEGRMEYRSARCPMGGALRPAEFGWSCTSRERVAAVLGALE